MDDQPRQPRRGKNGRGAALLTSHPEKGTTRLQLWKENSMKIKSLKLVALVFLTACVLSLLLLGGETSSHVDVDTLGEGIGDPAVLRAKYQEWEAQYVKDGGDRNMALALKWSKGLSSDHTNAYGMAKLNLIEGKIAVEVKGLPTAKSWDVWLIDNRSGYEGTVLPEQSDNMMRVGSFKTEGEYPVFEADLGGEAFASFEPELVVVTPEGKSPTEDRVLVATTTLFHKLYRSGQRGHFGKLYGSEKRITSTLEKRSLFSRLTDFLRPTAQAQSIDPFVDLVTEGRGIFFKQEFNGNGRTCGTCHRENNNLTIDPVFIATLPITDKLFVAETQVPLMQNFENPVLMRNVGLILENVDGFDNLSRKFAMRGVPHTLALPTSLAPSSGDGTTVPPNQRTGWGGDGAPFNEFVVLGDGTSHFTTGTLRDFAIGAVRQHFTRTLNRNPFGGGGNQPDFRFPTSFELDALEAFQLSTGRQQDLSLPLPLKGPLAILGQTKFLNPFVQGGVACNFCHFNAGANFSLNPPGGNRNFDTNVEDFPNPPGDLFGELNPDDGGFGATPCLGKNGLPPCGNATFNTPPLVEAADTGPFFHSNAVNAIESAVQFYIQGVPASFSTMTTSDVQAIAAFLRVINALENIRSAMAFEERAKLQPTLNGALPLILLAIADAQDGVEVLNGQSLHPDASFELTQSIQMLQTAATTADQTTRNQFIQKAINFQDSAKKKITN
jgi:hypothetical protein